MRTTTELFENYKIDLTANTFFDLLLIFYE